MKKIQNKFIMIYLLRALHTLASLYYIFCLVYLYYAAFASSFDIVLAIAVISLAAEGFIVYILNDGDCPLAYFQKKLEDDVPFFELFFPRKFAQNAFKLFSILTWGGVLLLLMRFFIF